MVAKNSSKFWIFWIWNQHSHGNSFEKTFGQKYNFNASIGWHWQNKIKYCLYSTETEAKKTSSHLFVTIFIRCVTVWCMYVHTTRERSIEIADEQSTNITCLHHCRKMFFVIFVRSSLVNSQIYCIKIGQLILNVVLY